jgi:CDP-diacylglycerol--glycerol-3-phosphate 3-phosphatidyltransferase
MNVSRAMTCSRIVFGPLFILCFLKFGAAGKACALILAGLIELTDVLDGTVARRRGEVSDLGRFLDPFADSLSRMSVFLAFFAHQPRLAEIWMVAVIFYRDMMVAYVRIWSMWHGVVQAARLSGKLKAIVQGVAILVICIGALAGACGWLDAGLTRDIAWWIMVGVTVVTAVSGIEYAAGLRRLRLLPRDQAGKV